MSNIFSDLADINDENRYVNDDVFKSDREDEKSDITQKDFEIAKLKAKIKNLYSNINYKNKKYEKLFSFYYSKHPDEVADIVKNNLLRL